MFSFSEISPETIHAFEVALTSGGDSRTCLGEDGRNKYHSSARPLADTALLGSCTSSSTGPDGYTAALNFYRQQQAIDDKQLQQEAIREHYSICRGELLNYVMRLDPHRAQVVIVPSGTDAEYIGLWVAWVISGKKPVSNIVIGPAELGSGSVVAAAAKFFDEQTPNGDWVTPGDPLDKELASLTRVHKVSIRSKSGDIHYDDDIDQKVSELVTREIEEGRHVLLHMVAHSKTGIHAPTLETINLLKQKYSDKNLSVIIDSAQGRFSRTGMSQTVRGCNMAIITGSKFFGGPGFCGAVVIPECYAKVMKEETQLPKGFDKFFCADMFPSDWDGPRSAVNQQANLGVLLRWRASLAEIIRYYYTPSKLRLKVMQYFTLLAPVVLSKSEYITMFDADDDDKQQADRLLQSITTVFFFTLSNSEKLFTKAKLYNVFRWLNYDLSDRLPHLPSMQKKSLEYKFQIGQPVTLMKSDSEEISVLRVAIGGVLTADLAIDLKYGRTLNQRLTFLEHQLEFLRNKLDIIAENYALLVSSEKS